jgi:hypothetical protein
MCALLTRAWARSGAPQKSEITPFSGGMDSDVYAKVNDLYAKVNKDGRFGETPTNHNPRFASAAISDTVDRRGGYW